MNLESFENEIARLESQLQDAIAALRALKDIQATFKDMQPRYERLKQLTDEAAGLPEHYAKQFETARKQAEARLAQLEAQFQQQADWKITVTQYQHANNQLQQRTNSRFVELSQRLETHQAALDVFTAQQQQAITTLNEQVSLVHTGLRELITNAMNKLEIELRLEMKQRFNGALWIGLLALVAALGTLAIVLLRK